jgi:cysteine desulfurase
MIYFDNSATTRPLDEVTALVSDSMRGCFGNASSLHALGVEAERRLRRAAETLAASVPCPSGSVVFTSGGTESINTAIKGYMEANPGRGAHIVTSEGEHPAAAESVRALMRRGIEATFLPLEKNGRIDPERLAAAIRPDTALITLIHVNNETGAINPVDDILHARDMRNPATAIHLDCVQSFGKIQTDFMDRGCAMASVSAHNSTDPREPARCSSGREYGWNRSCTEAASREDCAAVPKASRLPKGWRWPQDGPQSPGARLRIPSARCGMRSCRGSTGVRSTMSYPRKTDIPESCASPFPASRGGFRPRAGAEEVFVSTGSACSSRKKKSSAVLRSMGVRDDWAASAVRFSFSVYNTVSEAQEASEAVLRVLGRYSVRRVRNT